MKPAIWSCGVVCRTWLSFAFSDWNRALVSRMYRKTTRSSFIGGATLALKRGFFRTVSEWPLFHLSNSHGPLDTGIELRNMSFMFLPAITCAGYGPPETSDSQAAYVFLKTTVAVLPLPPRTDAISSQPARLTTLLAGLVNTRHVARKSAAVTSLRSL